MDLLSSLCDVENPRKMMVVVELVCCRRDVTGAVTEAARDCQDLASSTATLCDTAKNKGGSLRELSEDCQTEMRGLFDDNGEEQQQQQQPRGGMVAPFVFVKIQNLLQDTKLEEAVDFCTEMNDMAVQIMGQANEMNKSMTKAIDSLPGYIKEEEEEEEEEEKRDDDVEQHRNRTIGGGGDEESRIVFRRGDLGDDDDQQVAELMALMDVEADVAELENSCTKSRGGGFNLFSAATAGTKVFEQTKSKVFKCQQLFAQMKELCAVVGRIAAALINDSNCCTQIGAVVNGIASLFRCRRLAQLLSFAAGVVMRLLQAVKDLVSMAWQTIQGFMEEFDAAKKLGNFVNGVMNSKLGKLATGIASSIGIG
jgi:hypothetical protein